MARKGSFCELTGERDKPKSYHSCAVSSKEPRLLVKELQRMFGENKLLLRASGASFVKGDKNKTRFDIVIYKVPPSAGVSVFTTEFQSSKPMQRPPFRPPCVLCPPRSHVTLTLGAVVRRRAASRRQGAVRRMRSPIVFL